METKIAATKQRIIDAASDMIWLNSFHSISVDEICKKANVQKGSFYHYFESKIDLALVCIDSHYEEAKPYFDAVFSPSLSPVERLNEFINLIIQKQRIKFEEYGVVCGCPFMTLGCEMTSQNSAVRDKINFVMATHKRYYESVVRDLVSNGLVPDSIDVSKKADELYGYANGQIMLARLYNSLDNLEEYLRSGFWAILGLPQIEAEYGVTPSMAVSQV